MTNSFTYHVIDFLLPVQKFAIQFSSVSQKRLSFVREFVLRLVNLAPMSNQQIATYFGMSNLELDVAISDLVDRDELTINDRGLLTLTAKSIDYFSESNESPLLSTIEESSINLCFDLATFSCVGSENNLKNKLNKRAGLYLKVDINNSSISEKLVEKNFQSQFYQIIENNYLPNYLNREDKPSIYSVNIVKKIKELLMRLTVEFKLDANGNEVVRDDFEYLLSSEVVHELMTVILSTNLKLDNKREVVDTMEELGDEFSNKVFESNEFRINPSYVIELNKFEEYSKAGRLTFLGPIYLKENRTKFLEIFSPIIDSRRKSTKDFSGDKLIWIAPSDPFWGKSINFIEMLSYINLHSRTKEKVLYQPTLFVPVGGVNDYDSFRYWSNELKQFDNVRGIKEGVFGGNVEIIYMENSFIVIIYHITKLNKLPITTPLGFISTDKNVVKLIGDKILTFINGYSSYDEPNDCGKITKILHKK